MGILAVSVIPAMSQNRRATQGAARDEIMRRFEYARTHALATGSPTGVLVDTGDSSLTLNTLDGSGDVVVLQDPIGSEPLAVSIPDLFAGVTLVSFVNGDGTTTSGTVWFDYMGEPHTRHPDGGYDEPFTQNARVTIDGGGGVEVHAYSGFVEAR